ncbi:MAG: DHH family phosphoesterase [Clostridiaceae bacterium]|nr:DHH family phosphoesterase [Clostridiaceae bacterium]
MMISFSSMCAMLSQNDRIAILTHKRPDGDTLGSAAALCLGLRKIGKRAWLFPNPEVTQKYKPMTDGLWAEEGESFGFICTVDVADKALLTDNAFEKLNRIDLAIDHHPSFTGFGGAGYCDPSAAACGEIIYALLDGMECRLDSGIADAIYTAIATDTGCFSFDNTTATTHSVAAACFEAGADYREINYRCFRLKTRARVALEGHLYSSLAMVSEGRGAVSMITRDLLQTLGATEDDTDNLASLLTQIEGVKIGALLTEMPDQGGFKISMRGRSGFNVSEICALFGGGGHAGAAGCTLENMNARDAENTIKKVIGDRLDA